MTQCDTQGKRPTKTVAQNYAHITELHGEFI